MKNIIIMERPSRKTPNIHDKEEERVSTAPNTQRHKMAETPKINNLQLPAVRGKLMTKETKRVKKEQPKQHDHEQSHKRPQTSKGTRGAKYHESEYYEDDGDDLMVTSKQQKIDMFKKKMQQNPPNTKH